MRREISARPRLRTCRHFLRSSRNHQLAAVGASLGSEIDDPVRAFDDLDVVLDHEDAVAFVHEALQELQQQRDVVEVQTGGGLVEEKQCFLVGCRRLQKVADELQSLRLAAGQSVERLAETQVTEARLAEKPH